jgi:hypothetical protein
MVFARQSLIARDLERAPHDAPQRFLRQHVISHQVFGHSLLPSSRISLTAIQAAFGREIQTKAGQGAGFFGL